MSTILTRPVIARAYVWTTSDTVSPVVDGDAGGDFDLDNIRSPWLTSIGKLDGATTNAGISFVLNAQLGAVAAVEVLNTGALASEGIRIRLDSSATFGTAVTADTGTTYWKQRPDEIWTDSSYSSSSFAQGKQRTSLLLGYDALTGTGGVGPAVASPPDVATVAVRSGQILFDNPGSRTQWEIGHVALAIEAKRLAELPYGGITWQPARLRRGMGYNLTIEWPHLPLADEVHITALWENEGAPVFLFPVPAQKANDGTISVSNVMTASRGGLMRLTGWSGAIDEKRADGTFVKARLSAQTWQERQA